MGGIEAADRRYLAECAARLESAERWRREAQERYELALETYHNAVRAHESHGNGHESAERVEAGPEGHRASGEAYNGVIRNGSMQKWLDRFDQGIGKRSTPEEFRLAAELLNKEADE